LVGRSKFKYCACTVNKGRAKPAVSLWQWSQVQAMLWRKLRRIYALGFGQSLSVVNDKITDILDELWTIAHQLPVEDIFSILPYPEHYLYDPLLDALDEMEPLLDVSRVDLCYEISFERWNAFYPNLTGLMFTKQVVDPRNLPQSADFVSMQAKLVDGPGRRVLFRALGAKSVTVNLRPTVPLNEWGRGADDRFVTGLELERCELQLFNESDAELQSLIAALNSAEKSIAYKNTLAGIAGDYLPFKDWAAWDPESGEVDLPASAKFRELFHQ